MVACCCHKKCVSGKGSSQNGNLKCTDACSGKDCDNAEGDNETESFNEDSICDTDEEIDGKIECRKNLSMINN